MSKIRIFALAKQLKIESKDLVAVCNELQLGKGSALASLTEDEVEKVKAYLKEKSQGGGRTAAGSGAAQEGVRAISREDYIAPGGTNRIEPIPVLRARRSPPTLKSTKSASAPADEPTERSDETVHHETPSVAASAGEAVAVEEAPAAPVDEVATVATPAEEAPVAEQEAVAQAETVDETAASGTTAADVETPSQEEEAQEQEAVAEAAETAAAEEATEQEATEEAADEGGVAETEEHAKQQTPLPPVPPVDPKAPVRPLDAGPTRSPDKAAKPPREKAKPKPKLPRLFKLAPIPKAKLPTTPKPDEQPAQKPEIRLKPSALGSKPLAEHMRQQEARRKGKKEGDVKEAGSVPLLPRQRGRRGKLDEELERERGPKGGKRKRTERRVRVEDDDDSPLTAPTPQVRQTRLRRTGKTSTAAPRKGTVVLELPCTVRDFTEALGVPAQTVLAKLLGMGIMANINAVLDPETAELLAIELGVEVEFRKEVDPEEKVAALWDSLDDESRLAPRPPIVTFLGHVDHGKTSLLDRILDLNVVAGEKGGITQHIRAYRVEKDGRAIAFVDTPGHEAFTAMRARGANVTDIVVLVVAADDGVMPQTEEAINHARAAGVPIVVALNKIDLPGVVPETTLQQLAGMDLLPSEWGGDVEVVRTSALTGQGIDDLLETVLTLAELYEFKADPERPACGTCLEAEVQPGRGVVAKVLVQKGKLKVGDVVVCGPGHGRVKAMYDTLQPRKRHSEVGPSTPVDLVGLDQVPDAGDRFYVLDDIAEARRIAEARAERLREQELAERRPHVTLENLFERLEEDQIRTLNIILRADVRGSLEAVLKELQKLEHPEVQIKVLQAMVGGITEADVHLADASDAVILGFNVVPDEKARRLAEQLKVQIRRYDIIYQLTDDLKAALEGMLKPAEQEIDVGRALVQRVFHISRIGSIAGCRVLAGIVPRDAKLRVIRENRVIGIYPIESLRREKDDVREVREGMECGIKLAGFNDVKEGDILEAVRVEEVQRSLDE
ncbi:hypothetical protein JCM19992_10950 [Thermostilla marina]